MCLFRGPLQSKLAFPSRLDRVSLSGKDGSETHIANGFQRNLNVAVYEKKPILFYSASMEKVAA